MVGVVLPFVYLQNIFDFLLLNQRLESNVIKLSGLFVRLLRSRIFIGMIILYKSANASRSNGLDLMTLASQDIY